MKVVRVSGGFAPQLSRPEVQCIGKARSIASSMLQVRGEHEESARRFIAAADDLLGVESDGLELPAV